MNGKINYTEFLTATISIQKFLSEEKLWMLFKHFDCDDSGFITQDNIREALDRLNLQISEDEMRVAFQLHDKTN